MNDTEAEKLRDEWCAEYAKMRDEAVALVRQMREALYDLNLSGGSARREASIAADAFLSRHEVEAEK